MLVAIALVATVGAFAGLNLLAPAVQHQARVSVQVHIPIDEIGADFSLATHGSAAAESLAFLLARPAATVVAGYTGHSLRSTVRVLGDMVEAAAAGDPPLMLDQIQLASQDLLQAPSEDWRVTVHSEGAVGGEGGDRRRRRRLQQVSARRFHEGAALAQARAGSIRALAKTLGDEGEDASEASASVEELSHCVSMFSDLSVMLGNYVHQLAPHGNYETAVAPPLLCPAVRDALGASPCCSADQSVECHIVVSQMILGMGDVTQSVASHGKQPTVSPRNASNTLTHMHSTRTHTSHGFGALLHGGRRRSC